jgi:hypothetical protein
VIPLNQLNEQEKLWFLEDALLDAGATLRRKGFPEEGNRYINYVREMRGEKQEAPCQTPTT